MMNNVNCNMNQVAVAGTTSAIDVIRRAVNVHSSPHSAPALRHEAYQVCEEFKAKSGENIQLILALLNTEEESNVRHFALSMIEHTIKHCWNDISIQDKVTLKTVCIDIIDKICQEEPVYISDSMAKCVVEIVKREWPQNWPNFIDEMGALCTTPDIHQRKTDIVMRVLLRLSEDVVLLNTIEKPQRRKDIQTALTESLKTLLPFLFNSLQQNITAYQGCGTLEVRHELSKVTLSTLETIMGYVSWCDASLIAISDNLLIQLLIRNLLWIEIRMACVECLLVITYRHGNVESLSPILTMFDPEAIQAITNVSQSTTSEASSDSQYTFLKRLCQLIVSMGEQLCYIMTKEQKTFTLPAAFPQYVRLLLTFTSHSSLFISSSCLEFIVTLLRASKHEQYVEEISMELTELCLTKLQKRGVWTPGSADPQCLDYDSESEWLAQFHRMKGHITDILSLLRYKKGDEMMELCLRRVNELHTTAQHHYSSSCIFCDLKSPFYLQLEAVNVFLHSMTRGTASLSNPTAIQLLHILLNTTVREPRVASLILSCISALFPVLPNVDKEMFQLLLLKIFEFVDFAKWRRNTMTMDKLCIETARHASAIFIKLATQYPALLTTYFTDLHSYIEARKPPGGLGLREGQHRGLREGLVIVSNELKNYDKQSEYLQIILKESIEKWSDPQLQQSFSSARNFAEYIGLLSDPDVADRALLNYQRRHQIQELLRDFVMVLRRAVTPKNIQEEAAVGFINQDGMTRSPSADIILPILNSVMMCLNSTLGLYNAQLVSSYHPSFGGQTVLELPEAERRVIQGLYSADDNKETPQVRGELIKIQKHILDTIDIIQQLMMFLARHSPAQFYRYMNIAEVISVIIDTNISHVNWYVFRSMIKSMLKPLCAHCPTELKEGFASVIVSRVIPSVVHRLDHKWLYVKEQVVKNNSGLAAGAVFENDEDKTDTEIIEHELLRLSSRELVEMCTVLFLEDSYVKKKPLSAAEISTKGDTVMADNSSNQNTGTDKSSNQNTGANSDMKLTPLVHNLSQDDVTYLLWFAVTASCWLDTLSVLKSMDLILPLTKLAHSKGYMTADISNRVIHNLLTSINIHGQHDNLVSKTLVCLVQVYSELRPHYGQITQVMLHVPGVTEQSLKKFEVDVGIKLSGEAPAVQINMKKKRVKIQALISNIIGKNVSQQFKERIVIKNLPPLIKHKKKLSDLVSQTADGDTVGLCSLFLPSP